MGGVWVVGSVNVDLTVRVRELPKAGSTVTGGTFSRAGGGKGANQAIAAARAGARVIFTGAVGTDEPGDAAIAELSGCGIDVAGISRLVGVPTGVALIVVDEHGENQIAVASGANDRVDAALVRRAFALITPPPAVCLVGLEIGLDAVVAAAACAQTAGAKVVLNPAPARALPAELLDCRPLLTPNAGEAQELTGEADPERAARGLAGLTGAPVIVTLGAAGVLVLDGAHAVRKVAPTATVIDSTGAGDVFSGTLAAALAAGGSLTDAVDAAQMAAAVCVGHHGAR